MIECTAVLMAGGRSSRMGRDKAWLEIDGKPLWQHQLEKLRSLASEVIISARPGRFDSVNTGCRIILDEVPDVGPLGGLSAALQAAKYERVLVLAVDMPKMTTAYLVELAKNASNECGVVPVWQGFYQGLAAVYPRRAHGLVTEVLGGSDHSLQHLNRLATEKGAMRAKLVSADEAFLFENWNGPADIPSP